MKKTTNVTRKAKKNKIKEKANLFEISRNVEEYMNGEIFVLIFCFLIFLAFCFVLFSNRRCLRRMLYTTLCIRKSKR